MVSGIVPSCEPLTFRTSTFISKPLSKRKNSPDIGLSWAKQIKQKPEVCFSGLNKLVGVRGLEPLTFTMST